MAIVCAALASAAEMTLVAAGLYSYAEGALCGVALWLPCLFFAAGAVASGLLGTAMTLAGFAPGTGGAAT